MPELKILGGKPQYERWVPVSQPTMPDYGTFTERLKKLWDSRMITVGDYTAELEKRVAAFLGVKHVVAVNSNTAGQLLVLRTMGLKGEVILPSFSFCVTAHVLRWTGLTPVFVDVDPKTCTIDPAKVEEAVTPRTSAIIGVHLWGNPCRADVLQDIARRRKLRFITDAAQAIGARLGGRPVGGYGDAEIFSCSPTKLLTCGEGGFVATNDSEIDANVRRGRIYGMKPDYDCEFNGLNARMSEFNAAFGLGSLEDLDKNMRNRKERFAQYRQLLSKLPGISFPEATPGAEPNGIYFTVYVDADAFGLTRDELYEALLAEHVLVKKYFDPPLHRMTMYQGEAKRDLAVTERMCKRVLTFPLYSHSTPEMVEQIVALVARVQKDAARVRAALAAAA